MKHSIALLCLALSFDALMTPVASSAQAEVQATAARTPASQSASIEPASAAVAFLKSKGYLVGRHFDAGHGLTGWVVSRAGNPNVVYTTADGQVALIGALIDDKGANLTPGFIEQYGANPALPGAFEDLGNSHFLAIKPNGPTKKIIYVVFDANCPYCSVAYRAFKQHGGPNTEFRWVPVAYLKPDSANRAATMLDATDPVQALETNEEKFDEANHQGGIAAAASVPSAVASQLERNDKIMQRIGSTATPTILWKDDAGRVHDYEGLPPPDMLAEILGIAAPR